MKKTLFFLSLLLSSFLGAYELGIVSMFKNEAPYFKEWIEYHRMVGVDHFWLYDNGSSDNWREVLDPYIKEGLIETFYWPTPSGSPWVTQVDIFRDGLLRAQGKAKWIATVDLDEFLVPLKEKTIPECLEKHFSKATAVYVNWRNFGTGGVSVPEGKPFLFYLTACSLKSHSENGIGKSIVRPECVHTQAMWYPHHFPLNPGFQYLDGSNHPMYFVDSNLKTDGKHHDDYLRINHYRLRDETYFRTRRLPSTYKDNIPLLLEHYKSFSAQKDFAIINLIKNKHPDMYEKFWKNP